ncbi:MAG: response regulator [Desulfobulbaceae bacterium]|nr:response regulator [Desulfobulbaceae bacterium]
MIADTFIQAKSDERKPVILTVDDDPNNLSVVRDCLVECNYTILVAEDGESAVQRADYAKPDLILLDVMMPGIDGYETCRRLKSLESTKDIPVIFMTALAETGHKVKGLEVGAVDYITKPFQREELLARIAVHLHNRELTRKLQDANELLETRVEERTAELAQTIGALHDEIIARKKGEEERVRLATAIEQAAEAIFMSDAEWHFTYVNPAFERMSGYTRDEVLGKENTILRSDSHEPDYYNLIRNVINRDNEWSGRIATRKKNGISFEAETTVSSVRDSKGAIINYVFILRDVTHELRMERELRQSHKMEAIGTLAGGIAHDFNNILTAIIGYTEMAQNKISKNDPIAHDLVRVQEASTRAKEMVMQILTFSRQGEQERKPVQMATVIEEVFKLLRSTLPATIEIHQQITTSPNEATVLADSTQLHQVLMNLATNAAHAMRAHGGILNLSLSDIIDNASLMALHLDLISGPYVCLTVSDTGHGMESVVKDRIFDPYFTTKKVGEGTGMGLAVVQGIIKSHGGAISVYSEPGQGTTFHIFLPKVADKSIPEVQADESLRGGTERILFVDDEKVLVELGQELLGILGYNVTAATNSLEALAYFRTHPDDFDLVITDMTMPGLTGREFARELLAIRPNIPIIMCSGFTEFISANEAREAGICEFMMKPYVMNRMAQVIRRALQAPSSLADNPA